MIDLLVFGSDPKYDKLYKFDNTYSGRGDLYEEIMLITGKHGLAADVTDWCKFAFHGDEYEHEWFRVTVWED